MVTKSRFEADQTARTRGTLAHGRSDPPHRPPAPRSARGVARRARPAPAARGRERVAPVATRGAGGGHRTPPGPPATRVSALSPALQIVGAPVDSRARPR